MAKKKIKEKAAGGCNSAYELLILPLVIHTFLCLAIVPKHYQIRARKERRHTVRDAKRETLGGHGPCAFHPPNTTHSCMHQDGKICLFSRSSFLPSNLFYLIFPRGGTKESFLGNFITSFPT